MKAKNSLVLLTGLLVCANVFSRTAASTRPGDGGPALKAEICDPTAIAISRGSLFVAEGCFDTAAIRRIDLKTGVISTLTAVPSGTYVTALAADRDGNLIATVLENRIIRINTTNGSVEVVAGTGDYGFLGEGDLATKAVFNEPDGVAFDHAGNIFVADSANSRVRRIDRRTGIITTVAGSGKRGISGDGGSALEAGLENPSSIALDGAGNLYIGQNTNDEKLDRIRKVDAKSGLISTYSTTDLPPEAMIFDERGDLIFVELNRIKRISRATGVSETIAGSVEGFSGDGGPAVKARLGNPSALALDESGNLYIADYVSHRIRRIRAKDGVIETFAGNGGPDHVHILM